MSIFIPILTLGLLTLALAGLIAVANKKLYVYEDPRIDQVEDMLPHANCGACGFPGCRPFAEALVAGQMMAGQPLPVFWVLPWVQKRRELPDWLAMVV